jgi:dienelactone hydrolase
MTKIIAFGPALLCAGAIAATFFAIAQSAVGADSSASAGTQLPGPDAYPSVKELPDPFLFKDGTRVKTPADWPRRRAELVQLILGYEYGRLPAAATTVNPEETLPAKKDDATGATEHSLVLTMGPDAKVSTHLFLTVPAGAGPFPVIIKGDVTWGRVKPPEVVANIIKHGYILAEFDRTEIAPDKKDAPGGIRPLYPDADWGTLAAWAWGYHRVIDYLITRTDVDAKKVIVTGHSRGGKAALLAGALDERVALTVPNGSGCGGAGCYRVQPPKTEDIAAITNHFPYWFSARFPEFVGHVDQLPLDQHEVKALVAPRALLTTDGLGDIWANGPGTQATHQAAREVFKFLGAEDKIGIHYREGKHDQLAEDFDALLAFADHLFFNKPSEIPFDKLPFPDEPKAYSWAAPEGK